MSKSNIEWTGHTWNPLAGCSVLSPGCKKCYAMRLAKRLGAMGNPLYQGLTQDSSAGAVWTGEIRKAPRHTLLEPLRRKKPTTYFVNSMSDLFHEGVPDDWIDEIFAVMALCPQHTFQVLTKRAQRMRDYCLTLGRHHENDRVSLAMKRLHSEHGVGARGAFYTLGTIGWCFQNVWLGVSSERQQEADERIPLLLQTPAAIRFISAEPLLGPIDLGMIPAPRDPEDPDAEWFFDALTKGDVYHQRFKNDFGETWFDSADGPYRDAALDWVIVGGESGHGYREMDDAWARGLIADCHSAKVPVFMKQMAGKKQIPVEMFVREMPRAA